jgi:hypothetical protein
MVVHRLLRQTSTWRDNGRNELVTEDCAWITGNSEATRRYPVADRSRRFEASLAPRHFFGMREMRIHIFLDLRLSAAKNETLKFPNTGDKGGQKPVDATPANRLVGHFSQETDISELYLN